MNFGGHYSTHCRFFQTPLPHGRVSGQKVGCSRLYSQNLGSVAFLPPLPHSLTPQTPASWFYPYHLQKICCPSANSYRIITGDRLEAYTPLGIISLVKEAGLEVCSRVYIAKK